MFPSELPENTHSKATKYLQLEFSILYLILARLRKTLSTETNTTSLNSTQLYNTNSLASRLLAKTWRTKFILPRGRFSRHALCPVATTRPSQHPLSPELPQQPPHSSARTSVDLVPASHSSPEPRSGPNTRTHC